MAVFTPGQRLSQRYLLDRCVGSGGMSQVWLAHDELLGRPVAVKTIDGTKFDGTSADRATLLAAVRHEARTAASISHPHVAQVYDFGEAELPYLVMELIEGEDLGQRLGSGPLPWRSATRMAGEVAGALAAAHALGIVHGDIKPANVMLTPTGSKVVDFGISSSGEAAQVRAGTPAFLAPEVFAGDDTSPASDVYALGVLLYAALTGATPVAGLGWDELAQAHRDGGPIAPLVVDGLPDEIAALCARCLSAAPESRPTSEAVARALRAAIRRPMPPMAALMPTVGAFPTVPRPPTLALVGSRSARPRWWRAPAAVAASAIMLTGLVLIAVAAFSARGEANNPTAAPVASPPAAAPAVVEAAPAEPAPADEAVVAAAPAEQAAPSQLGSSQPGSSNRGSLDRRVSECLASVVEALKDHRGRGHHQDLTPQNLTPECRQLRSG